jgi:gamma-glutamylcyclotransferase (GGCT)/AIG2-like uncharacterized protein YtfP
LVASVGVEPTEVANLWYFAYGSNLCRATFLGRRRMQPLEIRVGRLEGYRLCFDLPVGPGERAVANLIADAAAHVWGALYHLTPDQCRHLDNTEGVPSGVYRRLAVTVSAAGGSAVAAFTYESGLRAESRKPSPRYMNLLLSGAREHGLPAEYVAFLRSFALARDEREEASGQLVLFPRR